MTTQLDSFDANRFQTDFLESEVGARNTQIVNVRVAFVFIDNAHTVYCDPAGDPPESVERYDNDRFAFIDRLFEVKRLKSRVHWINVVWRIPCLRASECCIKPASRPMPFQVQEKFVATSRPVPDEGIVRIDAFLNDLLDSNPFFAIVKLSLIVDTSRAMEGSDIEILVQRIVAQWQSRIEANIEVIMMEPKERWIPPLTDAL